MSDSEGDIDDELLALAGGESERKRKRSQPNSSSKRRKAEAEDDSDSDAEQPESEEEQTQRNPYPLEGKYIDEEDRARLMEMFEIDRENILAQRQEEMQHYTDRRQLENMLKMQGGRGSPDESVSNAAKRQHAVRGATKEKSRKLDELKAKRKAKSEKKRTRANSPKRDRSSSPMDMETSEDEEDGQITKYDEEEERDRKLYGTSHPDDEPITLADLYKCRVTRDQIAKYCMAPWFEDYIKGAWVRYLIGQENGQPVYRICEVVDIAPNLVKPYLVNEQLVNQELELKHGSSTRNFGMDKVSNAPFDQKEFDRLVKSCEADKVKLPTKRQIEKKAAQLHKYATQPMTESDIAAMLARKQAINATKLSAASVAVERSRLHQARTLAIRRQDYAEVSEIDARLAQLAALAPQRESQRDEGSSDILAKLNERNRKANMEAVRKAERAELERKRRERSLRAGTATPTGGNLSDAASRLRAKMLGNVGASRSVSVSSLCDWCARVSDLLTIIVHVLFVWVSLRCFCAIYPVCLCADLRRLVPLRSLRTAARPRLDRCRPLRMSSHRRRVPAGRASRPAYCKAWRSTSGTSEARLLRLTSMSASSSIGHCTEPSRDALCILPTVFCLP
ncbi:plus-3-domain-containing protein [Trametes sanguinea]|nr:plus-3-domain-containing protein [Trametes sanguinea]